MQINVELLSNFGSDADVAYAAWASSGKQENRSPKDIERLLNKIIKDGHDSCLEHIVFRFRIEAPLYIIQQINRHRLASYNQASGRYGYEFNKFLDIPSDIEPLINEKDLQEYNSICQQGMDFYKNMAEKYKRHPKQKRINEVLRGALPTATMSALVMTMNLRSWINFYKQRADSHAQPEIQTVAVQMRKKIAELPEIKTIYKKLLDYGKIVP
jgi:thymidylate synthase (FAD)